MSKWIETLKHVAHGNSSKQVAAIMGITIDAVTKNLERARHKLNAKTTTEAVYKAAKSGLIAVLLTVSVNNSLHDMTRISRRGPSSRTQRSSREYQQQVR
jgi:DNA-binding CsgD family transcriptional regulator